MMSSRPRRCAPPRPAAGARIPGVPPLPPERRGGRAAAKGNTFPPTQKYPLLLRTALDKKEKERMERVWQMVTGLSSSPERRG